MYQDNSKKLAKQHQQRMAAIEAALASDEDEGAGAEAGSSLLGVERGRSSTLPAGPQTNGTVGAGASTSVGEDAGKNGVGIGAKAAAGGANSAPKVTKASAPLSSSSIATSTTPHDAHDRGAATGADAGDPESKEKKARNLKKKLAAIQALQVCAGIFY